MTKLTNEKRVSRIEFPSWVCICCITAWSNYMSQCPRCTVIAGIEYFTNKEKLESRLQ